VITVSVIRLNTVRAARAIDALDAADRQCTAFLVSAGWRCPRADRAEDRLTVRHRLHAYPLPQLGEDAYAVLCQLHFDQIRRDDRKAAESRAAALAAETQTSLF
jgi:hypothetical protein